MRISAIDMYASTFEEALSFNLEKEDTDSPYFARTVLGLDTEEIIPKFYGWSTDRSSKFYDFKLKPREIVIRVVLNPRFNLGESFSDVRDQLYRIISANRVGLIELHFRYGPTIISRIFGSIIKFEAVHFTNLPEVQLTIRCNDPMFRGINPVTFDPSEIASVNPVHIPDSLSTSPHGFSIDFAFSDSVDSLSIQDAESDPSWKFKVIPDDGFIDGDVLHISSEYSNKQIYYVRDATIVPLADKIESGSIWPILFPGQNEFYFVPDESVSWSDIQFYASYWGV